MDNARAQTSRLLDLLRREQGAMADFLVALAAFHRERLWLGMGYSNLFHYLRRELKLSTGSAFLRKTAAELLQWFPEVEEPLRDGRLCLSSVAELAKVMTQENRAEVLPRFFYASKNEAKALAVEIAPREVIPQRVVVTTLAPRALPSRADATVAAPASTHFLGLGGPILPDEKRQVAPDAGPTLALGAVLPDEGRHVLPSTAPTLDFGRAVLPDETAALKETSPRESSTSAPAAPQSMAPSAPARVSPPNVPRTTTEPLTATQHRLHATVSKEFVRKLAAAKDALSHSLPGADEAAILEAGLDLILERAAKRKGLVKRPRKEAPLALNEEGRLPAPRAAAGAGGRPRGGAEDEQRERGGKAAAEGAPWASPPASRYIPAAVRRAVWIRDGGRCAWPTADGDVCGSTHLLQFDHVVPVAKGGKSTGPNVRICCSFHNQLSARQVFGDDWMDRYTRGAGAGGVAPSPSLPAPPA